MGRYAERRKQYNKQKAIAVGGRRVKILQFLVNCSRKIEKLVSRDLHGANRVGIYLSRGTWAFIISHPAICEK